MVHPSSRTARSTSLDSSSAVRDDGVPERELRVRLAAGSGHSGIITLAVGGEGAHWFEEMPAEATIVFVARHALAICWRGGSTSRRRRGRSCCCVSWTTRRCRPWMYSRFCRHCSTTSRAAAPSSSAPAEPSSSIEASEGWKVSGLLLLRVGSERRHPSSSPCRYRCWPRRRSRSRGHPMERFLL